MHFRRFACLILGAWLGAAAMMSLVATQNFRTVDRILLSPHPAASQDLKTLGRDSSRMLLRWEASEQNRWLFEVWETAQVALGIAVFFILLFGSTETKYSLALSLLMLVVVILQRFLVTPMMTGLGRLIDFVPPGTRSPERIKFGVLHMGYLGMEATKLLLGLLLVIKLMVRTRRKSAQAGGDIDVIDKAYHRHVNR
jgi:hypothetical protein